MPFCFIGFLFYLLCEYFDSANCPVFVFFFYLVALTLTGLVILKNHLMWELSMMKIL